MLKSSFRRYFTSDDWEILGCKKCSSSKAQITCKSQTFHNNLELIKTHDEAHDVDMQIEHIIYVVSFTVCFN